MQEKNAEEWKRGEKKRDETKEKQILCLTCNADSLQTQVRERGRGKTLPLKTHLHIIQTDMQRLPTYRLDKSCRCMLLCRPQIC